MNDKIDHRIGRIVSWLLRNESYSHAPPTGTGTFPGSLAWCVSMALFAVMYVRVSVQSNPGRGRTEQDFYFSGQQWHKAMRRQEQHHRIKSLIDADMMMWTD
jgi:hypothetical protein